MPELTYRRASREDAEAIAAVSATLWREQGEGSGLREPLTTVEGVTARLAGYGDQSAILLCEGDEGACGFALLEPYAQEEGAAVMGVWVLPSARRQGTGRELALMALEFARAAGYRKVRGTLPPGNEAALSFFSEIGALAQVVGQGMQYELPL
jgi:ribosomal protein S18 acetylase RimI-like enzyme